MLFRSAGISAVCIVAFLLRERRAPHPIFNLQIATRRTFWVAAVAGIIVFGSLMGSLFIGQQFLQNVLDYGTFQAGLSILPAAVTMALLSPLSARLIPKFGSRITLMIGFVLLGLGFASMFLWNQSSPYVVVGLTYAVLGAGVAIAAAPASRSITDSVPASELGMGSATNDLQRDLGGAIMQSVMGSLLVVRYSSLITAAFNTATPQQQSELSGEAVTMMTRSYTGAEQVAQSLPGNGPGMLLEAAKQAFTGGSNVAYGFALLAVIAGLAVVAVLYPNKTNEARILAGYEDTPSKA